MLMQQKGFTLVEIAIVLVIIGLLLGGVLKGQEIITNARLKNAVNVVNGISAAYYSYIDRYGAIPGDDELPKSHIGCGTDNTAADGAGDGNGSITGDTFNDTAGETNKLWRHLRGAGLIKGDGNCSQVATIPKHPWGGEIGVDAGNGILNFGSNSVICFKAVPGDIAVILDNQNDDGKADSGSVRAAVTTTANAPAENPVISYDTTQAYDVCFTI